MKRPGRVVPRRRTIGVVAFSAALAVAGCAVSPDPIGEQETLARMRRDLQVVLAHQEPLSGPVSMVDAMARAIKYNLDERVKLMEMAVADRQLDLSHYDLLPRVVAGAGYAGRSNESGSVSLNLNTGRRTDQSSTSQDRDRVVADLGVTWNVLDFGVSYLRARQNADLSLVAEERRRRVVQGILQDVRTAFWRAVAAERLLGRIEPLERRIEAARRDAGTIEALRVQSPARALTYQRDLLDTQRQLQSLRRELAPAKSQLAALMGLPPGEPFALEVPTMKTAQKPPVLNVPVEALETYALMNRPELREETLNARISADETRRALLKLLPGLDLNAALRYDSNSYLLHSQWADYGARVSWNLLSLLSYPATQSFNEAQEDLVAKRRQALSMAVLSQVRVAVLQFNDQAREYALTEEQAQIEERLRRQYTNVDAAGQGGELDVIQADARAMLAQLRRDLVYADLQNAYARTTVSAGVDPLPEVIPAADLATLKRALAASLDSWQERANVALRARDLAVGEAKTTDAATPEPKPTETVKPAEASKPPEPDKVTAKPAAVAGGVRVKLGTYANESLAREEWEKIVKKFRKLVDGHQPIYVATQRQSDGKPFVVLRLEDFADRSAAVDFCSDLKAGKAECLVIRRSDPEASRT